ncbi:MAG: metallophosphoesterase [Clostridiaceae bacterium]
MRVETGTHQSGTHQSGTHQSGLHGQAADNTSPRGRRKIGVIVLVLVLGWLWWDNSRITVRAVDVSSSRLPQTFQGFRLAQVSDLHSRDWKGRLIERLTREQPNLILITGDLIDSKHPNLPLVLEFVRQAQTIAPVYFVSGNHEVWSGQYEELKRELQALGVGILDNESNRITRSGSSLTLLGLPDPELTQGRDFTDEASDPIDRQLQALVHPEDFQILLAHRPEFAEYYAAAGIDLVLSGHAHGGQFRLPLLGGLYAPGQGYFPKYTAGLHRLGHTSLVISRGLGNSVIPVRLFNPPELVMIRLLRTSGSD